MNKVHFNYKIININNKFSNMNLSTFIIEASRNEKRRKERFAKNMFIKGSGIGGIFAFGILTGENPDSADPSQLSKQEKRELLALNKKNNKELLTALKQNHLKFTPIEGHFGGVVEHSYMVFNISLEQLTKLAGKYEQTSFFYCQPNNKGDVISQYWEKEDKNAKYNSVKNPYKMVEENTAWSKLDKETKDNYSVIGGDFKYTIDMKVFESVSNDILNRANEILEYNGTENEILNLLTEAYSRTGSLYYNKRVHLNGY